nr:unknown [Vibrio phage 1]
MFVDLGYHLEHNNGSVFNKDFIFSSEKPDLQKILDCQASGQAPNLNLPPCTRGATIYFRFSY